MKILVDNNLSTQVYKIFETELVKHYLTNKIEN